MSTVVTINGIHESAAGTTDRMADRLEHLGFSVHRLRYPPRGAFETRNRLKQYLDAKVMLGQLPWYGCDVVAHSWGCLLACRMMELGGTAVFRRVIFFAPAIDPDWVFPLSAFDRLIVVHNRHDRAVWAARVLFRGWHPWGDMGRVGYQGVEDPRVTNVEDRTDGADRFGRCHSHYFASYYLPAWSQRVSEWLQACDVVQLRADGRYAVASARGEV